jgi:IMP dehydrogenase
MIIHKEVLSFDDVIMLPQYSNIESRKEISTSIFVDIFKNDSTFEFRIPIISSPMSTISEDKMCNALCEKGGFGIIHRYNTIEKQTFLLAKMEKDNVRSAAIGVSGDFKERLAELVKHNLNVVCIDVAHGDHVLVKNTIEYIKSNYKHLFIIAGNIATGHAYRRLSEWGADAIRTSVGSGSICTTRLQTGHGMPTFQAVLDCNEQIDKMLDDDVKPALIIADGGIKNSGDIAKALGAGADFVMLGSMLSGTSEAPGKIIEKDGMKMKEYNGMASKKAQKDFKGSFSSVEGVSSYVEYKGHVKPLIDEIMQGVKSAMSYSGSYDLNEFKNDVIFVKQTSNSHIEGTAHIFQKGKK